MLILEGADLTGKTTYAGTLIKHLNSLGWPHIYQHLSRPPKCWNKQAMENYRRIMSPYIVQDRFAMSGVVYRAMDGEPCDINSSQYSYLTRQRHIFTVIITCEPLLLEQRWERLVHNDGGRVEMYGLRQVLKVNEMYRELVLSGGRLGAYECSFDLAIHCTANHSYPTLDDCGCLIYTGRLNRLFPYPGAVVAEPVGVAE